MNRIHSKAVARHLRSEGKSYREIYAVLGRPVPKSTLAAWCKGVVLPEDYFRRKKLESSANLVHARDLALQLKKEARQEEDRKITERAAGMLDVIKDSAVTKLLLAALYWAEGGKNRRGGLLFGNSDPGMMTFFLYLLRSSYRLNPERFRVTVQCRADQDGSALAEYWSEVTQIPLQLFYREQVDRRTLGKPTKKLDYKGVCRVDYFSAEIYRELMLIIKLLQEFKGH